jgi:hypothetical protein
MRSWRAWFVVAAVISTLGTGCTDDGADVVARTTTSRDLFACSEETVDDLIAATAADPNGLAPDTAEHLTDPTCVHDLALAKICLLCADPNGARFEVLLQRDGQGVWHLVEIAVGEALTSAASRAGISPAELSELRRAARGG